MTFQQTSPNNNGRKTLLVYHDKYIGAVQELLTVGDIFRTSADETEKPFVVINIFDMDADLYDSLRALNFEKIAFLEYEDNLKGYKKATSLKLEKKLAKRLGGRIQPGSGAFLFNKGDVKTARFLAEQKFTDRAVYRLQLQTWNKILNEAITVNKMPILEIILNQDTEPLNLAFMNILDFQEVTKIPNETALLDVFYIAGLDGQGRKSIALEYKFLKNHIDYTIYNVTKKIPAFWLQFSKTLLLGLQSEELACLLNA